MHHDSFWAEYDQKSEIILEDLEGCSGSVEFNFVLGLLTRMPIHYEYAKKILWFMLRRELLKINPQGNLMVVRRTRVDGAEELKEAIQELEDVVAGSDGPMWEIELLDSVGMSEQLARSVLNAAVRDGILERIRPPHRSDDCIQLPK